MNIVRFFTRQVSNEFIYGICSPIGEVVELFVVFLATEIVSRIKKGEWTASQVLEAYIAQAKVAHDQTNCLTEGMRVCLIS